MSRKSSRRVTSPVGKDGGVRRSLTPARVTGLVLAVLALVFIFENTQETEIRLLVPVVTMPLWVALLATGVIGALCGALFLRRRG
ncbi:LapA family protein [Streptomyces sp. NPDC001595]|uniref:LapA family protein n=1 Tax=Streptomyces sp. NPDC001532 TaxID=3154520 RepID=UPI003331EB25